MKWWKRIVFSVISLIWGFCSFDYLFYAFQLMTNKRNPTGEYHPKEDGVMQLLGLVLLLVWFVILSFYYYLLRRSSNQIDLVEADQKTGKEKVRRKWFDTALQAAFLLTGLLLRWCYLLFIYFPGAD